MTISVCTCLCSRMGIHGRWFYLLSHMSRAISRYSLASRCCVTVRSLMLLGPKEMNLPPKIINGSLNTRRYILRRYSI